MPIPSIIAERAQWRKGTEGRVPGAGLQRKSNFEQNQLRELEISDMSTGERQSKPQSKLKSHWIDAL